MPRRPRPTDAKRSEYWLRVMVNERSIILDTAISEAFKWDKTVIDWRSPFQDDEYAEYYDDSFLERLGVEDLLIPLAEFWPRSGPRWDGLGRTDDGKLILVEAKAHIAEAVDYHSKATGDALKKIEARINEAKAAFHASNDACWHTPFYQMANRLAHLYYLAGINNQDAYLVFIYFANAPDVPESVSPVEWRGAIRLAKKCLGLKDSKLARRVASIIVDLKHGEGTPNIFYRCYIHNRGASQLIVHSIGAVREAEQPRNTISLYDKLGITECLGLRNTLNGSSTLAND